MINAQNKENTLIHSSSRNFLVKIREKVPSKPQIVNAASRTIDFLSVGSPPMTRMIINTGITITQITKKVHQVYQDRYLKPVEGLSPEALEELKCYLEEHIEELFGSLALPLQCHPKIKKEMIAQFIRSVLNAYSDQIPAHILKNLTVEKLKEYRERHKSLHEDVAHFLTSIGKETLTRFIFEQIGLHFTSLQTTLREDFNPYQKCLIEFHEHDELCDLKIRFSALQENPGATLDAKAAFHYCYQFDHIPKTKINEELQRFLDFVQKGEEGSLIPIPCTAIIRFLTDHFGVCPTIERHSGLPHLTEQNPVLRLWSQEVLMEVFSEDVQKTEIFLFETQFHQFLSALELKFEHAPSIESEVASLRAKLDQLPKFANFKRYEATLDDISLQLEEQRALQPQYTIERHSIIPPALASMFFQIFDLLGIDDKTMSQIEESCRPIFGSSARSFLEKIKQDYRLALKNNGNISLSVPPEKVTLLDKVIAITLGLFLHTVITAAVTPLIGTLAAQAGLQFLFTYALSSTFSATLITSSIFTIIPVRYQTIYMQICRDLALKMLPFLIQIFLQIHFFIEKLALQRLIPLDFQNASWLITRKKIDDLHTLITELEADCFKATSSNSETPISFDHLLDTLTLIDAATKDVTQAIKNQRIEELQKKKEEIKALSLFNANQALKKRVQHPSSPEDITLFFQQIDDIAQKNHLLTNEQLGKLQTTNEKFTALMKQQKPDCQLIDHLLFSDDLSSIMAQVSSLLPKELQNTLQAFVKKDPVPIEASVEMIPQSAPLSEPLPTPQPERSAVSVKKDPLSPIVEHIKRDLPQIVYPEELCMRWNHVMVQGRSLTSWLQEIGSHASYIERIKGKEELFQTVLFPWEPWTIETLMTFLENEGYNIISIYKTYLACGYLEQILHDPSKQELGASAHRLAIQQTCDIVRRLPSFSTKGLIDPLWRQIASDPQMRSQAIESLLQFHTIAPQSTLLPKEKLTLIGIEQIIFFLIRSDPTFDFTEYGWKSNDSVENLIEQISHFEWNSTDWIWVQNLHCYLHQEIKTRKWEFPKELFHPLAAGKTWFGMGRVKVSEVDASCQIYRKWLRENQKARETLESLFPNQIDEQLLILANAGASLLPLSFDYLRRLCRNFPLHRNTQEFRFLTHQVLISDAAIPLKPLKLPTPSLTQYDRAVEDRSWKKIIPIAPERSLQAFLGALQQGTLPIIRHVWNSQWNRNNLGMMPHITIALRNQQENWRKFNQHHLTAFFNPIHGFFQGFQKASLQEMINQLKILKEAIISRDSSESLYDLYSETMVDEESFWDGIQHIYLSEKGTLVLLSQIIRHYGIQQYPEHAREMNSAGISPESIREILQTGVAHRKISRNQARDLEMLYATIGILCLDPYAMNQEQLRQNIPIMSVLLTLTSEHSFLTYYFNRCSALETWRSIIPHALKQDATLRKETARSFFQFHEAISLFPEDSSWSFDTISLQMEEKPITTIYINTFNLHLEILADSFLIQENTPPPPPPPQPVAILSSVIEESWIDVTADYLPQKRSLQSFADSVAFKSNGTMIKVELQRKGVSFSLTMRDQGIYFDETLFVSARQHEPRCDAYGDYLCLQNKQGDRYVLIDFFSPSTLMLSSWLADQAPQFYSSRLPHKLDQVLPDTFQKKSAIQLLPIEQGKLQVKELNAATILQMALCAYFKKNKEEFVQLIEWFKQKQNIKPLSQNELSLLFPLILGNFSYHQSEEIPFFLNLAILYLKNLQQKKHLTYQDYMVGLYALFAYTQYIDQSLIAPRIVAESDELILIDKLTFLLTSFLGQAQREIGLLEQLPQIALRCGMSQSVNDRLATLGSIYNHPSYLTSFTNILLDFAKKPSPSFSLPLISNPLAPLIQNGTALAKMQVIHQMKQYLWCCYGKTIQLKDSTVDLSLVIPDALTLSWIEQNIASCLALLSFTTYPPDNELFQEKRKALLEALSKARNYPKTASTALFFFLKSLDPTSTDPAFIQYQQRLIAWLKKPSSMEDILAVESYVNKKQAEAIDFSIREKAWNWIQTTGKQAAHEAVHAIQKLDPIGTVGPTILAAQAMNMSFGASGVVVSTINVLQTAAKEVQRRDVAKQSRASLLAETSQIQLEAPFFESLASQDERLYHECMGFFLETFFDQIIVPGSIATFTPIACLDPTISTSINALNQDVQTELDLMNQRPPSVTYHLKSEASLDQLTRKLRQKQEELKRHLNRIEQSIHSLAHPKRREIEFDQIMACFLDQDLKNLGALLKLPEESDALKEIMQQLHVYLLFKFYHAQIQQILKIAAAGLATVVGDKLACRRNYQLSQVITAHDPNRIIRAFLLFEAKTGMILREKQISQTLEVMKASMEHDRICAQYIMGMGKTAFFDVWNTFVQWKRGQIPILIIPDNLIPSTSEFFGKQFFDVFGKKLSYISFDRSCTATKLQALYYSTEEAKITGDALLFSKDGFASMIVMLKALYYEDLIYGADPERESQIGWLQKILLNFVDHGCMTGDEAHKLFDRKIELNFPVGSLSLLPPKTYQIFERVLIAYFEDEIQRTKGDIRKISSKMFNISQGEYHQTILPLLAQKCIDGLPSVPLPPLDIDSQYREELLTFWMDRTQPDPTWLKAHPEAETIFVIRGLLLELIPQALEMKSQIDYGKAEGILPAVPFAGSNAPQTDSLFQLPYMTALLTQFTYYRTGLPVDYAIQLKRHLTQLIKDEAKSLKKSEDQSSVIAKLQTYCDSQKEKIDDYSIDELRYNWYWITYYISTFASKEISYYEYNATCNGQHFGSSVSRFCVVTGTPDNHGTFPLGTHTLLDSETLGVTGYLLQKKLKEKTSHIIELPEQEPEELAQAFLRKALQDSNGSAIIDEQGFFQDGVKWSNEEVARRMLKISPEMETVVFYDKDQKLKMIQKETGQIILFTKDAMDPNKRLTLYDQVHTVGSDIVQPSNALCALSIGTNTTWSSFAQAIWRLRGFYHNQNIKIMITPTMKQKMEEHHFPLDLEGILNCILLQEKTSLVNDRFFSDLQKIENEFTAALERKLYTLPLQEARGLFKQNKDLLLKKMDMSPQLLFGGRRIRQAPVNIIEGKMAETAQMIRSSSLTPEEKTQRLERLLAMHQALTPEDYPETVVHSTFSKAATVKNIAREKTTEQTTEKTTEQTREKTTVFPPGSKPQPSPKAKWQWPEAPITATSWIDHRTIETNGSEHGKNPQGVPVYALADLMRHSKNTSLSLLSGSIPPNLFVTGNLIPYKTKIMYSSDPRSSIETYSTYSLPYWRKPALQLAIIREADHTFKTVGIDPEIDLEALQSPPQDLAIYDLCSGGLTAGATPEIEAFVNSSAFGEHIAIWTFFNCMDTWIPKHVRAIDSFFNKQIITPWIQAYQEIKPYRALSTRDFPHTLIDHKFTRLTANRPSILL